MPQRKPGPIFGRGGLLAALAWLGACPPTWAQAPSNQGLVVRDGSIGTAPPGIVAPGVDDLGHHADYLISADLGEQRGGNLFHSFEQFSIGSAETATFTAQGAPDPGAIDNVISRVTGASVSDVDGTIRSTIDGADVWLMNPNGIVFGEDARLDVPAGFHASTADSLALANGEAFEARRDAPVPVLGVDPPEAFGFLGDADVRIGGPLEVPENATLSVAAGGAVEVQPWASLSAGSVRVTASRVALQEGALIESTGSGAAGEVRLDVGELDLTGGCTVLTEARGPAAGGDIVIAATKGVTLSGADAEGSVSGLLTQADSDSEGDAGAITVVTPVLRLEDGAFLGSETWGTGDAGDIVIEASQEVVLSGRDVDGVGSLIASNSYGSGGAGSITLTTGALRLEDGAEISSRTFGEGDAGDIVIDASTDVALSGVDSEKTGSTIGTATFGNGNAGSITLTTEGLRLQDGATILSQSSGSGDTGNVVIEALDDVVLSGWNAEGRSSGIAAFTASNGSGNAGTVLLTASLVHLADGASLSSANFGAGAGGTVRLDVGELEVTGGSSVDARGVGLGAGGDIVIDATEGVTVSGAGPRGNQSGIRAGVREDSQGGGGSITVTTPVLRLEDGAIISIRTHSGDAGGISIEASEEVVLSGAGTEGGSAILADTLGSGDGGTILVKAPRVRLADGATVSTITSGRGDAGNIVVVATEGVTLFGADASGNPSSLSAGASFLSQGDAGAITVTTPVLQLEDGAIIASAAFGTGDAGDIVLEASEEIVLSGRDVDGEGSLITALTASDGDAGSVLVKAPRVRLAEGASFFSGTFGSGAGGDVEVVSSLLEITNASISAQSEGSGDAGSVRLTADELLAEDGSEISVAATSADGGDVVLAVRDRVHLVDSTITADVGDGAGGNILIDPTFVILDHSDIVARAGAGTGGEITIVADALIQDPESLISASAGNPSLSGTVNINAPDVDLAGSLAALSESALDASDQLAERCSARRRGEREGSFTVAGGGLRPGPEGWLPAWGPAESPSFAPLALANARCR